MRGGDENDGKMRVVSDLKDIAPYLPFSACGASSMQILRWNPRLGYGGKSTEDGLLPFKQRVSNCLPLIR